MTNHLLEFYGTECPHCVNMHELVERLEKEEGIKIEAKEVWHNRENAEYLQTLDKDMCGGVPFFLNLKTNKFICGADSYENLKNWAQGK